jgi:beta-galactosidase
VNISGPAKLIGLDNGNQSDVTPFKSNTRKAFGGRLLFTVQAKEEQGDIKLELKSPHLKDATYTINAVSSL